MAEIWSKDVFVGPPVKYDEKAKPIKTYCDECGHETGEMQPHAKDCECVGCWAERTLSERLLPIESKGKSITFRKIEGIR